jgi:hypothetical protein
MGKRSFDIVLPVPDYIEAEKNRGHILTCLKKTRQRPKPDDLKLAEFKRNQGKRQNRNESGLISSVLHGVWMLIGASEMEVGMRIVRSDSPRKRREEKKRRGGQAPKISL